MNEYRFQTPDDTPPQKYDPGYGDVVYSREKITVRKAGEVFSIWCGTQIQITSENEQAVSSFIEGLRSL